MRAEAIYNVYPTVVSTIGKEAFDKDGNIVTLDESVITTEVAKLQADFDALEYARNRASATGYPSIPDQLDEIYHNGIDSWKAVIKVTKDKFPKG